MSVESPEILFNDELHEYKVEGIVRPSVTQILRDLGFIDFSKVPPQMLEEARVRGKAVHQAVHYLEEDDLEWSTVDPRIKPYLEAYQLMKDETGFVATRREHIVFDPLYNFAGQLDAFGSMARLGVEEVLADYKSGVPQEAARYQTAGYACAIKKPYVPRCSIHLKANGRYAIIWHRERRDVEYWRCIVTTWHLRNGGKNGNANGNR